MTAALPQPEDDQPGGSPRQFATTSWSMVLEAGDEHSAESRQALEQLCQIYWYPLYAFVRRKGHSHADAEELTQGFFAHLLDRNRLQLADRQQGRFRSFLLRSLENYMIQDWRKRSAQKRGGDTTILRLDFEEADQRYSREPADKMTPQKLYDRKWALEVLQQVLQQLESWYKDRGKQGLFEALKPYLVNASPGSWKEVAEEHSLNEIAVKVAAHRMRQKYRGLLREWIGHTVESPGEIEQEINDLFTALGRN
jgi:RNA polymerase sigma-70 factor (ECF subfamily)